MHVSRWMLLRSFFLSCTPCCCRLAPSFRFYLYPHMRHSTSLILIQSPSMYPIFVLCRVASDSVSSGWIIFHFSTLVVRSIVVVVPRIAIINAYCQRETAKRSTKVTVKNDLIWCLDIGKHAVGRRSKRNDVAINRSSTWASLCFAFRLLHPSMTATMPSSQ